MLSKALEKIRHSEDELILVGGAVLALALRLRLLPVETLDFRDYFGPWYEFIRTNGGFLALKFPFSNNTPVYLYLMVLASFVYSKLPAVAALKLISIPFDFICAAIIYKIVQWKYTKNTAPVFAFLAVLFAPTVLLNSSMWGETDIIYTTFLLLSLYFILTGRERAAFLAYGLSLSIKLQAIFFLPVLVILLMRGSISWKSFIFLPVVYMATIIPAWLMGRPFGDLLTIYLHQSETYGALSMNAPNMYQWVPNNLYNVFYPAGMIWSAALIFVFCIAIYKSRLHLSPDRVIQLSTISLVLLPYVLPKMHDRFTFAADVVSIVYGFFFPRYFFIPLMIIGVSFLGYFPFLFGYELVPLRYLAFLPPLILVYLLRILAKGYEIDEKSVQVSELLE